MKKNITLIVIFVFAVSLIVDCSGSSDYMVLNEIRYINTFPQIFSIDNGIKIDLENIDVIGIINFRIYDSLLVIATSDNDGLWSFVSLPDFRFLGKFLTIGQGPYEFFQYQFVGDGVNFFKENEEIFSSIFHFDKGKLYKMNIDESIKNQRLDIYTIHDSLPPVLLFDFVEIDSVTFFCKEISNKETQQIRYLLINGEKIIPHHFKKLNLAKIREREDFNILSTSTKYDFSTKRIVEMPGHLNYINIYSIDGSFGKTICIGEQLDNIGKIQDRNRWTDRMATFNDLRLFSNFWGVLFINEIQTIKERKRFPNIFCRIRNIPSHQNRQKG